MWPADTRSSIGSNQKTSTGSEFAAHASGLVRCSPAILIRFRLSVDKRCIIAARERSAIGSGHNWRRLQTGNFALKQPPQETPARTSAPGCGFLQNARGRRRASVPRGGPPGFPRRPDCQSPIPQSSNWLGRRDISRDVKNSQLFGPALTALVQA